MAGQGFDNRIRNDEPSKLSLPSRDSKKLALNSLNPDDPETGKDLNKELLNNKDFIKEAVEKAPQVIKYASKEILNDHEFLTSLIKQESNGVTTISLRLFDHFPKELLDNRKFIETLLEKDINALGYASERIKEDPKMYDLLKKHRTDIGLEDIPESLRNDREFLSEKMKAGLISINDTIPVRELLSSDIVKDREFMRELTLANYKLVAVLPKSLQRDIPLIHEVVAKHSYAYNYLPDDMQLNKEIATIAYKSGFGTIYYLPPDLKKDEKFIVELLTLNGHGFEGLDKEDKSNKNYIKAAIKTNKDIIEEVPLEILKGDIELQKTLVTINYNAGAVLREKLGRLDQSVENILSNTREAFKILNFGDETYQSIDENGKIINQGRYDATQEILNNRYRIANEETQEKLTEVLGEDYFKGAKAFDGRPVTLVLLPKLDHNDAFHQNKNIFMYKDAFDELTISNNVIVYDVGSKDELREVLREFKASSQSDNLIIGAHGQTDLMSFGYDETKFDEFDWDKHGHLLLTVNDKDIISEFNGVVKPDGKVILLSCSTGKEVRGKENIADALHDAMNDTTLYAPTAPTPVVSLVNRQTGLVEPPQFEDGKLGDVESYILSPKESVELDFSGLSRSEKILAGKILAHNEGKFDISIEQNEKGAVPVLKIRALGDVNSYNLANYSAEQDKLISLEGADLTRSAIRHLLHDSLFSVAYSKKYEDLWKNWAKPEGDKDFITAKDPLLIQLKSDLSKIVGINSEHLQITLNAIPGLMQFILHSTANGEREKIADLWFSDIGLNDRSKELNLRALE